ncbi:MAG: exodeoxyribonuclease VII large subunit [Clostridiales bacterium]|nr:exodeoxyribonuclease VII large subunit [Clostridiales bacterium]
MWRFDSVSALGNYIKDRVSGDPTLSSVEVTGEISKIVVYTSGHAYFVLKDEESVINSVMFRSSYMNLDFIPEDGQMVTVKGRIDYYAANGKLQLICNSMSLAGTGNLFEQYKKLYAKLEKEGLFLQSAKKTLPILPQRIGVITSPLGAVIHDIVNTLRRRNPHFELVVYPSAVSGSACPPDVINGLKYFQDKDPVDVIIIARGGGSYEDLYGFNDEGMARAVYSCTIPVVSGIGHDNDYTILDYVADIRAHTPTAAAEIVMPKLEDLVNDIENNRGAMDIAISNMISSRRKDLDMLKNHKALYSPVAYVNNQKAELSDQINQLNSAMNIRVKNARGDYNSIYSSLIALGPMNVLKRGYSIVTRDHVAIDSVDKLTIDEDVTVMMSDGQIVTKIKTITKNADQDREG